MNKKRILQIVAMVLLLSMMLSTAAFAMPPGQAKKLLKNENKYKNAFKHMKENDIMYGYGDGNYGLGDYVKRGDITVMIVRAFKLSMMGVDIEDVEEDFLDLIDKNSYYYNAVKTAKKLGIAKGDGKNFQPNRYVSYEEAMLLIERAVKVANSNVTVLDDDGDTIKLRDWYKEFVKDDKDAFSKYLSEILKEEGIKDFSKSAAREDIALMLYYVLTGNKDYELDEKESDTKIVIDLKKLYNKQIDFDDLMGKKGVFEKALKDIEDKENTEVKYVKFDSVSGGTLYYDYDAKKQDNSLVSEKFEYYINGDTDNDGKLEEKEISRITFIPDKKDNKNVYIKFTAYAYPINKKATVDKAVLYQGLIIISENYGELPVIKETIKENTSLDFGDLDFEDFFEDYDVDEVKFVLPDEEVGILKINEKALTNIKYELESIEDITFVPAADFTGKVEIKYTVYGDNEVSYNGVIEITVLSVFEIKDIVIKNYDEEDIDFVGELEDVANKEIFKVIDYVMFKLPKAKEGKLLIKYDEDGDDKNDEEFVPVIENKKYDLEEIEGLKYEPYDDNNDEIPIFYAVYDKITGPDKKYDGAIVIEMD